MRSSPTRCDLSRRAGFPSPRHRLHNVQLFGIKGVLRITLHVGGQLGSVTAHGWENARHLEPSQLRKRYEWMDAAGSSISRSRASAMANSEKNFRQTRSAFEVCVLWLRRRAIADLSHIGC